MPDVFISYKKEDVARAEPIARALARAGYDVWWDHRIPPGRSYRDVIGAALSEAKCVIVIWSNLSANAQWVLDEADEGKRRGVLLPLLIDDVEIPYGFRQIEAARLVGWNGEADHPEWKGVLDAVTHFVGRAPGGPPKPLVSTVTDRAPAQTPAAAIKREAVAPKAKGGGGVWIGLLVLALIIGGGAAWYFTQNKPAEIAEAPAEIAADTIIALKINTDQTDGFYRQDEASWVEVAPDGVARFRFTHEREEGAAAIIFDETRNVRLRLDPNGGTITEEATNESGALFWRDLYAGGEPVLGAAPPAPVAPAQPSDGVIRVWFEGGGSFALRPEGWYETSREDGMHAPAAWREESRDADTITLRDDGRQAGARLELGEGQIYLFFPDWGQWRLQWRIRAVDRE